MEINISKLATLAKVLPSKRLITSRAFTIEKMNTDQLGYLSFNQENIRPSLTGTAIDYMTRSFALHSLEDFKLPIQAVLMNGNKKQLEELKHDIINYLKLVHDKSIDEVDEKAFFLMLKISAWEENYRGGIYTPVTTKPNKITLNHYRIMIKRMQNFFKIFGNPAETGYLSYTDNKMVHGDGDYLLAKTLVDLKVSKHMMTANWIRQLLLYYVLLRSDKVSVDDIEKLMIVNPRFDQVAYVNIRDIDINILDFVLDQTEKISKL